MAKSFVLKALGIFGLEEMLNLSQARQVKTSLMKKAAGEDLVVWNDAPESTSPAQQKTNASSEENVLPFRKTSHSSEVSEPMPDPAMAGHESGDTAQLCSSDLLLWQRELTKDSGRPLKKQEAAKGYSKAAQMYVVKSTAPEGNEKIRFASTNGVLVNKKQA